MTSNERYLDPSLRTEERLDDLMGRMTLPEKVGQMLQLDAQEDLDDAVLRMHAGSMLHTSPERLVRAMDLARGTRLGIPLLTADDAIHGHSFWRHGSFHRSSGWHVRDAGPSCWATSRSRACRSRRTPG